MKKIVCLLFIIGMQLYGYGDSPLYEMPQPLYGKYNPLARLFMTSYADKTFNAPLTIKGAFKGTKIKAQDITSCGPMEIKDSIIDGSIETLGSLTIENSTVTGKVRAKGAISAKDVNFKDSIEGNTVLLKNSTAKEVDTTGTEPALVELKEAAGSLKGSLRAKNSIIEGKVTVKGPIWADDSQFKDDIEAYDSIFLENRFLNRVTAKDIYVQGSVNLIGDVTIEGTIYYKQKRGLVFSPGTTITGGLKLDNKKIGGPIIKGKIVEPEELQWYQK